MVFGGLFVGDFWVRCRSRGWVNLWFGFFGGWIGFVRNRQCFQVSLPPVPGGLEEIAVVAAGSEGNVPLFPSVFNTEAVRGVLDAHQSDATRRFATKANAVIAGEPKIVSIKGDWVRPRV